MKLPVEQFDMLFIDEAQDTNRMQQELALRACPSGRIFVVGDRYQSIYGFRGADVDAIPRLVEALGATKRGIKQLPLTVSWRCAKSHVQIARCIVEDIEAAPNAPEGEIQSLSPHLAEEMLQPGDMVICRVNADLVPICYNLIRKGVKAVIRGRDIGKNLLTLIGKLRPSSLPNLMDKLDDYFDRESQKLQGRRAGAMLIALQDKCDCIRALSEGIDTVEQLKSRIETIFSDVDETGAVKRSVLLGTIHRTKGLEANNVFIAAPHLIPHPLAKQPWERAQEMNLAYVAATRAKYDANNPGRLIFMGPIPPLYQTPIPTLTDARELPGDAPSAAPPSTPQTRSKSPAAPKGASGTATPAKRRESTSTSSPRKRK